jgi:hypothetical protein
MMTHRRRIAAVVGSVVFAVCVPVASAGASMSPGSPCGTGDTPSEQGAVGGTTSSVCQGSGLSFIGPSVGQVATVIGPTVIGPATVGNAIVSAGNVIAGAS